MQLDDDLKQAAASVGTNLAIIEYTGSRSGMVRDGRAQWEYVTTGLENAEWIEILSDNLEEGDIVVTSGHFTLAHDTRVTIAEPAGSGGGS